jgi:serine/threonine protein kinase/Tfp pilus assembly protein PilF
MDQDKPRVDSIFLEAVEKPTAEERAAYLDRACASDAELRQRIERLLAAESKVSSFLESPAPGLPSPPRVGEGSGGGGEGTIATVDEPVTERPGTVIGPYKLLEQIGEGGFGIVFMAEQTEPVRRKVALKVLKPGMDTRQVVARFEAERQALALMDHPNIAKVLDAGQTSSGRPYFVMDLVKGLPITDYSDQNSLPVRDRLELFLQVCQAIQHAHQKGIIHRDIKPTNVLVTLHDGAPLAKVIDFGIAKALGQQLTDKTLFTNFAQLVGTPLYMSPEQAAQGNVDVDTRSDIYSLGVLVYELLTGTTPFDKERFKQVGYDELRRIIREEDPPKPSTRISTLGKTGMASGAASGASNGPGSNSLTTPANRGVDTPRSPATDLDTIAAQRKRDPKRLSHMFRGELDWIVMKALEKDRNRRYESASALAADVQRYLKDEPVLACPPSTWYRFCKYARRNRGRLAIAASMVVVVLGLAGSAAWFARQKAVRQVETQQAVTTALAQAGTLLAEGEKQIDQPERWQATTRLARAALEKAQELLAAGVATPELAANVEEMRAAVEADVTESRLLVELDRIRLEQAAVKEGHFDETRTAALYATLLEGYGVKINAPEIAAERVRSSALREALVWALYDCSRITRDPDERRRVEDVLQAAEPANGFRAVWWAAVRRGDSAELVKLAKEPSIQLLPPAAVVYLARALKDLKELPAAERVLRAAQVRHPDDFWVNFHLGMVLRELGPTRAEEAVGYLRVALALRSNNPAVYLNLGVALSDKGDEKAAISCYQAALRIDPNFAKAHNNLGYLLHEKNLDAAIQEYQQAIQLNKDLPEAHCNLGRALLDKGQPHEAVDECREALRLNSNFADAHNNLGCALDRLGQPDAAIREYREAIRIKKDYAKAHYNLGVALFNKGQPQKAIAEFQTAIQLKKDYPEAHYNLGLALDMLGRTDDAIREYGAAIGLKQDNPRWHYNFGNALFKKGEPEKAIAEFQAAIRLKKDYANAHCNLGYALMRQGQFKQAVEEFRLGHDYGSRDPQWRFPSEQWLREAKRLDDLDARLPGLLKGEMQANDAAERLAVAQLCLEHKKFYAAAADWYAKAFAAQAGMADDLSSGNRYNAACAAALAGCGHGQDAKALDAKERARLRGQALEWLRADLAAWSKRLEENRTKTAPVVRQQMQHWLDEADFVSMRGSAALAKLPEEERQQWQKLWADVDEMLAKAQAKTQPVGKSQTKDKQSGR